MKVNVIKKIWNQTRGLFNFQSDILTSGMWFSNYSAHLW